MQANFDQLPQLARQILVKRYITADGIFYIFPAGSSVATFSEADGTSAIT